MKKIITVFLIVILVFLGGSCDHTDLSGDILIVQSDADGRNSLLLLEVPDELNDIYDVMWAVRKENIMMNELIVSGSDVLNYYDEEELKQIMAKENLNFDRIALFIPSLNGQYTISADGFYKQTNPQPITRIEVEVK